MAGHWGVWEPYVQLVTGVGSPDVVRGFSPTQFGIRSYLVSDFPSDNIFQDPLARQCCMKHVIAGSNMDSHWTTGFASCPAMIPAISALSPSVGPQGTGLEVAYSGGGGLYSDIQIIGRVSGMGLIANTDTSHGMPSWQDPHNAAAPPEWDYFDGELTQFEYAPFTSIDGDITMTGLSVTGSSLAFEVQMRAVPYVSTGLWNNTSLGSLATSAIVGSDGSVANPATIIPLDDLAIHGHGYQFVCSLLAPGTFYLDDPINAGFGYSPWLSAASPLLLVNIRRHGMRRPLLKSTPPLHQRQRGDGIGGGPIHSGISQNSRQGLLYARGIF